MGKNTAAFLRRCSTLARPSTPEYGTAIPTTFGTVTILWRDEGRDAVVSRILLPTDPAPGSHSIRPRSGKGTRISDLASRIRAFCRGEDISFDIDILDLGRCRPFQRLVLRAECGIPRGMVSTYGRIARHIGHPGAARAVGTALATNPFPLVVPCHRAVREGGELGGFRGGLAMKRALLELEGRAFTPRGKVVMDRIHY